jgi:hypothetical protein
MIEVWAFSRDGQRYHMVGRDGERVLVVHTDVQRKLQGVLLLEVESGEPQGQFLDPEYPIVHDLCTGGGATILLIGDRPPGRVSPARRERLRLAAFAAGSEAEAHPLWVDDLAEESVDELPDVSIALDSGKLYVARGALLEARDALSGRLLGEMTIPGLDERVAWKVSHGAGLLAEENRASVFEIPA